MDSILHDDWSHYSGIVQIVALPFRRPLFSRLRRNCCLQTERCDGLACKVFYGPCFSNNDILESQVIALHDLMVVKFCSASASEAAMA